MDFRILRRMALCYKGGLHNVLCYLFLPVAKALEAKAKLASSNDGSAAVWLSYVAFLIDDGFLTRSFVRSVFAVHSFHFISFHFISF